MRKLSVFIEINGSSEYVGEISGIDSTDACFSYADTYLNNPEHRAISIGLPLEEKVFNSQRTRIFFEGLLPECFIVTTESVDEEAVLFATKRYDRKFSEDNRMLNGMPVPYRMHQEDFAQALGIAASNKYEKNNERYLCF